MRILILLMTLIPTLVFANLGDTRAESEKRYGVEGIPWHIGKKDNGMVMYHPNQWAMLEWYNAQGISECITYYRNPPSTPITYDEVKEFVLENGVVDLKEWEWNGGNLCKDTDYLYEGRKYRYFVSGVIGSLFHSYTIATPEGMTHMSHSLE
jgi:hypothetical protein